MLHNEAKDTSTDTSCPNELERWAVFKANATIPFPSITTSAWLTTTVWGEAV
jgi:hypothetical protein